MFTTLATLATVRVVEAAWARPVSRADAGDCVLDLGDYPDGVVVLKDLNGATAGACIAALREQYLVENGSADTVMENFDYEEILRSFSETALALATGLIVEMFEPCDCDNPECPNQYPDPESLVMSAGRHLLYAARSFEKKYRSHLPECRTCRDAGDAAPDLVRAQFCRDLSDDLICNFDGPDLLMHGVPLQAGFDVVCMLLETIEELTGQSVPDQVEELGQWLARTRANLNR